MKWKLFNSNRTLFQHILSQPKQYVLYHIRKNKYAWYDLFENAWFKEKLRLNNEPFDIKQRIPYLVSIVLVYVNWSLISTALWLNFCASNNVTKCFVLCSCLSVYQIDLTGNAYLCFDGVVHLNSHTSTMFTQFDFNYAVNFCLQLSWIPFGFGEIHFGRVKQLLHFENQCKHRHSRTFILGYIVLSFAFCNIPRFTRNIASILLRTN